MDITVKASIASVRCPYCGKKLVDGKCPNTECTFKLAGEAVS